MATGLTDSKHYTDIANAIREKTGETEQFAPSQMAEKVADVYDKGKQDEYDKFWDSFQWGGTRTDYVYAFYNWKEAIEIKPKYPLVCVGDTTNLFYRCNKCVNLPSADLTAVTGLGSAFYGCLVVEELGEILPENNASLRGTFCFCHKLHTIRKLKITENTMFSNLTFRACLALENIEIVGTIAQASLTLADATKLSKASITSIINALSSTKTGLAVTLSKTAVNKAFETSTGANNGSTSQEWLSLVATKSNWTISLA